MRARYTVVLALLLVALGAYLYFVESKRIADESKKKPIVELVPDDVTRVTLTYPDHSEVALDLRDGAWYLSKPLEARADDVTVKALLRTIADGQVKRTIDDPPADLTQFGLAEPSVTIAMTAKDQALPAIKVGRTAAVSASTYVQRADQAKIYLTDIGFHSGTDKHVNDFRDKTIVTFKEDDVVGLAMQGPGGGVELRKRDGNWMIERPVATRADDATVGTLLTTLHSMHAETFVSDNPSAADLAAYGLDKPTREIVLLDSADKETRLQFGDESEKGLYVKVADRPSTFIVGTWAARDLGKSLGELREKTVLQFDPAAVGSIQVQRGDGETFTLVGKDGTWSIEGVEGAAEAGKVKAFVDALSRLKGSRVLSDKSEDIPGFGLAHPVITISVTGKDGNALGNVRLGIKPPDVEGPSKGKGGDRYTALRERDNLIVELLGYQYNQLNRKKQDFVAVPATPTPTAVAPAAPTT